MDHLNALKIFSIVLNLQEQMTDAYKLLMQVHGSVHMSSALSLQCVECLAWAVPIRMQVCFRAACLPTWDQHNAGWLTSWVLLISSSSLAI